MESSFTFLRVRGIPIGAHWSWVFVFALLAWSLGSTLFPRTYPGLEGSTYLAMGLVSTVLFFASILLHELGHAFRALREGMRIEGITLWLFGGVARFAGMFPSAGAEFRIAAAGPAASVAIAAFFMALAWLGNLLGWSEAARGIFDYLGRINALLVAFNLVPALPLDGGRILRAWLWHRQRSFAAATLSAARAGRAFAMVLIGLGVAGIFTEAVTGGVWFAFLGWFLLQAAQAEASFALVRQAFRGLRVRDLMTPDPVVVPAGITVHEFFDEIGRRRGHSTYPVVENGRLAGLVSLRLAGAVPLEERHTTTVDQVMLRGPDVAVTTPDTPMLDALEAVRSGPGRAVVLEGDRITGIVSASDVGRALELEQARGPVAEPSARRAGPLVWVVVTLAIVTAAAAFYHPPIAVLEPGPAIDISQDMTIDGVETTPLNGKYLLTSVRLDQPSALMVVVAVFDPEREVIPVAALIPRGISRQEFFARQRAIFDESRMLAAAAAARSVGLAVKVTGSGARVVGVIGESPAEGVIRRGDVIVAVDGEPVGVTSDVRDLVRSRPPGTRFTVAVERDGGRRDLEVTSARLSMAGEGAVGIGVYIETRDFDLGLPFEIEFKERDIGGPSAGLAYALAVADALDPQDLARGRTIATTGTMDIGGRVGAVGGVGEKAVGARRAGAALFLVPAEEVGSGAERDLDVRGVSTLDEAIALLKGAA